MAEYLTPHGTGRYSSCHAAAPHRGPGLTCRGDAALHPRLHGGRGNCGGVGVCGRDHGGGGLARRGAGLEPCPAAPLAHRLVDRRDRRGARRWCAHGPPGLAAGVHPLRRTGSQVQPLPRAGPVWRRGHDAGPVAGGRPARDSRHVAVALRLCADFHECLDRLVYERVRLGMMSALAVRDELTFSELKALFDVSDGNLSAHARKLEEARYVTCTKSFDGRRPKSVYHLTAAGRAALNRYLDHIEAVIKATRRG